MRTILIVAHDYAPLEGTGAQRVTQLARHLPAHGFRPLVLTTTRYGVTPSDAADGIHRAPDWIHDLTRPLRHLRAGGGSGRPLHEVPVLGRGALARLRDAVMVPDTRPGWHGPALRRGMALIREQRPALVFSSSPPETAHLVASRLARRHELPWVADLRDGWAFEPPNPDTRRGALRAALERRLERALARDAALITAATAPIADDLRARHPGAAERVAHLPNGYDPAEFEGLARQRPADGAVLVVHTGALAASRAGTSAVPLLEALAAIARRDPGSPLRLRFVGRGGEAERAAAHALGLADRVSFVAPVTRRESHQHQLDADVLLLVTAPGQRSVATLKLFDYVGAGRPILALARDNAAAALVGRYRLGRVAAPDDAAAIEAALLEVAAAPGAVADPGGLAEARRDFDWRRLTGELAALFERALAAGPPR